MRALIVGPDQPARVRFTPDYPQPSPAADEVLIRVTLAGICATDLEIARGYLHFAGVLGHEFVGTVVEGASHLVGRRVVAEINCPCRQCEMCRGGLPNHCLRRTVVGIAGRDGAFADYLTVPAANCHLVADQISDRQAVFVEPLAAAAHVLDAAEIGPGRRAAVLGTGRLGLLVAQVLADTGCELEVIGRNPRTIDFCRRRGLKVAAAPESGVSGRYDVVVECTGCADGLRLALGLCRPCGTIVLKSTYADAATVDLAPLVVNEIRLAGNRCGSFPRALRLLAEHRVEVDELVTAEYALEEGVAALEAAARAENIKVLLRPGGP